MYHIKDDQRSIRSSKMLYDGLAKLIQEVPFNSIKVKDLVAASNVGRTTFYRNFDDIEDILKLRCDQVSDGLLAYMIEYMQKLGNQPPNLLKPVLRYFYLHSEIIELLMIANRLDIVQSSFLRVFGPYKIRAIELFHDEEEFADYSLIIRIGIVTNILVHWIENGKKRAPDELADNLGAKLHNWVTLDQLV